MSIIAQIQTLVRNGLYYLTEHADDEAALEGIASMMWNRVFLLAKFGERGQGKVNMK